MVELQGRAAPVALEIDGVAVETAAGTSILRAAAEAGIDIPRLCATDSLKAYGSCRLCMVEIEGRSGFKSSCTEPVREGMQVRTQTPALAKLRKGDMELYISDHPLDCLTCSANGDCELQDMAGAVALREVRYEQPSTHLDAPTHVSNPYFAFDPSKCIVCSRCVRACNEVQGTFALTVLGRGFDAVIATGGRADSPLAARTKGEVLLMAAVDYSIDKLVVHVGPHPPPPRMRDYASARGKRIIHIPLGSLSPVSVRKVRVVHILAGREQREIAKDYVW